MREKELSRRLNAAFLLVREGETVVDVGTDHAYLPIALVKSGKTPFAYASDIGKGPLERAKENINKAGLNEKIKAVLTDGATVFDGLAKEFIIAGMGGELIFEIISKAPFFKNNDIHLILQPMTKVPALRHLLFENGFNIEKEILIFEDEKIYTVMSVYYTGTKKEISDFDAIVGNTEGVDKDLLKRLLSGVIYDLNNKIKGKNDPSDINLKSKIEDLIKNI